MAKHGFYMALQKKKQLKSIRRGGKQKGQVANLLHTKKKSLKNLSIMIAIFQVVKGRRDIAWACTPTQTKTGIDFCGYNCAVDESLPNYITVVNLTNPNNNNLWDSAAAQRIHRVSAVDGDTVMILTPEERYLVYMYNGEAITIFSGNSETAFPSQEEIDYQISLIPESIGRLKIEMHMNELFAKWPGLPNGFDFLVEVVYKHMKKYELEYTLQNVQESLSACIRESFEKIK